MSQLSEEEEISIKKKEDEKAEKEKAERLEQEKKKALVAKEQSIVNDEIEQMLKLSLKDHKPKPVVQNLIDGITLEQPRAEQ